MSKNAKRFIKKDNDNLKETIRKLKAQISNLEKMNRQLQSENGTLREAWRKTEDFLKDVTNGVPLEEVLKYRRLPKKALRMQKEQAKKEEKSKEQEKEEVRQKWKLWRERKK